MYVARFTINPQKDIERNWSGYMGMEAATVREFINSYLPTPENFDDMTEAEMIEWLADEMDTDLRFDTQLNMWRACHHDGLSCWTLEATTSQDAINEAATLATAGEIEWAGFGQATVGSLKLIGSVDGINNLYIFECERTVSE